ncbi:MULTISPECIES: guanine deaminase [Halocynthiibacter]|uniref:Guanine deaminase n=1 Tax=Halocynthiibacter halioticoli TaxID=2986804 RepID=A0AAE3J1R7_9RHOB|nr:MULTISPECIES: guanine deaminase [Halocynthiibacter]MCV6824536.1 guanine deaminase [Halocynthiibacter halioticoli]MCW4057537.1 guanine deaminase [Halocynthiibacter sp. SDUM655004]
MSKPPSQKLLRGRVLDFNAEPQDATDTSAYTYLTDGAILIEGGRIADVGTFADVAQRAPAAEIVDHRPNLLMAGFIDTHVHFPQVQVIASWGAQLLDWLNTYTFPEETRFAEVAHAEAMASKFYDLLTAHGTTTAVAYCSVHKESAEAFFGEAARRNMCMIGGKVMMDRNAPDGLRDTPQTGYDDSKDLIAKWHGKGRAHYAITPRFAITSTPEQLEMTGALVAEHADCFVQTHLSENHDEIAFTAELYPDAPDYLGVYETYGLLTPKMLLGHSIHLTPREIDLLAQTRAKPVFCPTSNLFLGSGLFDDAGLRGKGICNAIATDIGAGTSYSMLQTLNEGYKILQLQGQKLHPLRAFHWITRGNAVALGLEDKIGTLAAGSDADIVVLDARATPASALRMERAETLSEELFILQMLGDDRAVSEVYVAGVSAKTETQTHDRLALTA